MYAKVMLVLGRWSQPMMKTDNHEINVSFYYNDFQYMIQQEGEKVGLCGIDGRSIVRSVHNSAAFALLRIVSKKPTS